jgi:hypothetical protein
MFAEYSELYNHFGCHWTGKLIDRFRQVFETKRKMWKNTYEIVSTAVAESVDIGELRTKTITFEMSLWAKTAPESVAIRKYLRN